MSSSRSRRPRPWPPGRRGQRGQAAALNTQDTLSEAATLVEAIWMAATALQRDQGNTIQTVAAAAKAKIAEAASDLAKFNPARRRAA